MSASQTSNPPTGQDPLYEELAKAVTNFVETRPYQGRRSRENKYWRFGPKYGRRAGWIFVGVTRQSNPHDHDRLIEMGCEELPDEYGVEPVGGSMSDPNNLHLRFYNILSRGGLKEFPASQIIAYGWHTVPQVRAALTPEQRAEVERWEKQATECRYGCWNPTENRVWRFYSKEDAARHYKAFHKDAAYSEATAAAMKEAVVQVTQQAGLTEQRFAELVAAAVAAYEQIKQEAMKKGG